MKMAWAAILLSAGATVACGTTSAEPGDKVRVVTTTDVLADIARVVGGADVEVTSLVPFGGDPHSYEPTPKDALAISQADVAFSNHLLLEQQSLVKMIDASGRPDLVHISVAENAEPYGARFRPLVENLDLDTIWLGLRVHGTGAHLGANRSSSIDIRAVSVDGPGDFCMYLVATLGDPEVYMCSADGIDEPDVISLPPSAHTHVNWAFTAPGLYQVGLESHLRIDDDVTMPVGGATFTFMVASDALPENTSAILDSGHTDLTTNLDTGAMYAFAGRDANGEQAEIAANKAVIIVPVHASDSVPDDPRFSFLGTPGSTIYQLPQAVLGKHVHGDIDPHLWLDVNNFKAYVSVITESLAKIAPSQSKAIQNRADVYQEQLDDLHNYVAAQVSKIPQGSRKLVTTHDAFGYLADAYGLDVVGFVVPNPSQEPSAAQVRKLSESIARQQVSAVFVEPNLIQRASVLKQIASDMDVAVCELYGDSFDDRNPTYLTIMRHNADELVRCLTADGR
jgi:anchored repeat ABC transporter substrate-binding protein